MNYSKFITEHILKKQTYTKSPKANKSALLKFPNCSEQCYSTELSAMMEMFVCCAVQHGSHGLPVATADLKCGYWD